MGMRRNIGIVAATAATPSAIMVLFVILALCSVWPFAGRDWGNVFLSVQILALVATPLALVMSLGIGRPLGDRLAKRGRTHPVAFLLLGAALGAFPFLLFDACVVAFEVVRSLWLGPTDSFRGVGRTARRLLGRTPVATYWVAMGSWCGAWSALAYWGVVHRGVPSGSGTLATEVEEHR
jgi:hypothetical protein